LNGRGPQGAGNGVGGGIGEGRDGCEGAKGSERWAASITEPAMKRQLHMCRWLADRRAWAAVNSPRYSFTCTL